MSFLASEDFIMIGDAALKIVQQADPAKLEVAINTAVEELSGYLRSRYDTTLIFAATGDNRNEVVVMYACDIALYHLTSSRDGRQGMEIRKERYDRAIKWLEDVQKGNIMPNLPTPSGPDGEEDINNPIRYGSQPQNVYDW